MARLLSDSDITKFGNIFSQHFDTFKRTITIFKESLKTYSNVNANAYEGYGPEENNQATVTYTAISGNFNAIINYGSIEQNELFIAANRKLEKDQVRIKVQKDCRDYILNGKTELVTVDNNYYNVVSSDAVQTFLNNQYYYFTLQKTN